MKNRNSYERLKSIQTSLSELSKSLLIGVNFGKSYRPNCYIEITPRDIGWT